MMNIYIVIIEDRHADTDVVPFMLENDAIDYARNIAKQSAREPSDYSEYLTDNMIQGGWKFNATYSCESDSVRVLEKELHV